MSAPAPVGNETAGNASTLTFRSATGVTVQASLTFQSPTTVSTAQTAWSGLGGKGAIPCVTDPQTDAVIVGTLRFTNQTPSYTPDFYVNFKSIAAGGPMALAAGYSDGSQCITDGSDAWEGSALQPNWTAASWGPLPIAIVIHNDIGPSYPTGNPANLTPLELELGSSSGDSFTISSTTGGITDESGQAVSVALTPSH